MEKRNYSSMKNFSGLKGLKWGSPIREFVENGSASVPRKEGHVYSESDILRSDIISNIKIARTYEDLDNVGRKLNYAIDNGIYEVGITNLQVEASKKMREIYNKLGEYSGE